MKNALIPCLLLATVLLPARLPAQEGEKKPAPPKSPPTQNDWSRSELTELRGEKRSDKKRHGGAAYSRLAEKGLDWLVRHQQEDGSWSSHRMPEACAKSNRKEICNQFAHTAAKPETEVEVGLTGLALLAFAGRGNTYLEAEDPKFRAAIDHAVKWLIEIQIHGEEPKFQGFIGRKEDREKLEDTTMYGHAIATLALCELLLGTGDVERLATPARAAVDWCLRAQNPEYAWHYGYMSGRNATPSTIWLATAILLGEECAKAGLIDLPAQRFATSRSGTMRWLEAATSTQLAITGYQAPGDSGSQLNMHPGEYPFSKAMSSPTAGALFYRTLESASTNLKATADPTEGGAPGPDQPKETDEPEKAGETVKERSRVAKMQAQRLLDQPPNWRKASGKKKSTINFYFWAFASQAIALAEPKEWLSWRKTLERQLSKNQELTGCSKGSWDPIGEWSPVGGRVYSTSMAILALESSYRFQVPAPDEKK